MMHYMNHPVHFQLSLDLFYLPDLPLFWQIINYYVSIIKYQQI